MIEEISMNDLMNYTQKNKKYSGLYDDFNSDLISGVYVDGDVFWYERMNLQMSISDESHEELKEIMKKQYNKEYLFDRESKY